MSLLCSVAHVVSIQFRGEKSHKLVLILSFQHDYMLEFIALIPRILLFLTTVLAMKTRCCGKKPVDNDHNKLFYLHPYL